MPIELDKIYILNPNYDLRNDMYRVILFSRNSTGDTYSPNWSSFIHPIQAMLLSFFTAKRTLEENLIRIGKFFNRDKSDILKRIFPLIENEQILKISWKENDIYLPRFLLIQGNENVPFTNLEQNQFICKHPIDLVNRRLYSGPLSLTFMLTNDCATRCIYCYADIFMKVKQKVTTKRLLDLIDEAIELKVSHINLIGGEVFLFKDWPLILKKLVVNNIAPEYISTKLPLNKSIIEKIIKTEYTNPIQISLDTNQSDILEKTIAAKRDYLERTYKGLSLLDNSGLNYHIATVITKYNDKPRILRNLYDYLSTLEHLTDWRISPVSHSINASRAYFQKIKGHEQQLLRLFDQIEKEIMPKAKFPIYLNQNFIQESQYCETGSADFKGAKCSALNTHLFVLPDGKVTICEQLYWNPQFIIGDINNRSLNEIWNSPQSQYLMHLKKSKIQKTSPCYSCKIFEPCFNEKNRCWAEIIKAYGKQNWDFPDPRCKHAIGIMNLNNYLQ